MDLCVRCRSQIWRHETHGESSLYSPDRSFTLCEPCFFDEDAEIEREGTNNLPDRLADYIRNETLGPLP